MGDGPLVVREKTHQATPMTLDQALYEMELVGHDFYLFVDESLDFGDSSVYHLEYDGSDGDGQKLTKLGNAPLRIVGAGVSTCAQPDPQ